MSTVEINNSCYRRVSSYREGVIHIKVVKVVKKLVKETVKYPRVMVSGKRLEMLRRLSKKEGTSIATVAEEAFVAHFAK